VLETEEGKSISRPLSFFSFFFGPGLEDPINHWTKQMAPGEHPINHLENVPDRRTGAYLV